MRVMVLERVRSPLHAVDVAATEAGLGHVRR
jgi:hypothetical protein